MLRAEQINKAIAPYIIGNAAIKKLLFIELFTLPAQGEKVNTLLIGDTASGKTDIGQEVTKISNNAVFLSRETTMAGLVGVATRSGMRGGVINKADNGVLIMDELDKTDSKLRKAMIQLMDKYQINITKRGFNIPINVKCNIVATANPVGNNWISGSPSISEVPFSPTLLNRFHLVAPFESLNISDYDKLVQSFKAKNNKKEREKFREKMREFIYTARDKFPDVKVPERMTQKSVKYIKKLKSNYSTQIQEISPRQIEGFLTLIRAHTRMYLRDTVTDEDFNSVKNLYDKIVNLWVR